MRRRQLLVASALTALVPALARPARADLGTMKVGVLKFGTVNWELDVIKFHKLDEKEGYTLDVQAFGGNDAADVALMGDGVNAIVEDWLWVSRQRSSGTELTFIPYSSSVGALMVKADGPADLAGLKGKKIGVSGGKIDKGWILLQAYAKDKGGIDIANEAEIVYGAPPLLTEKIKSGELDAVLNYWHFCARLEAEGYRRLIGVTDVQEAFGVPPSVPQLGYVFKQAFADSSTPLVEAFARSSRAAKQILLTDDAEWQRLREVTRAENDAVLAAFMRRYREGIVQHWGPEQQGQAAQLYTVLEKLGGEELVGPGKEIAPGTFWPKLTF